MSQYKTSENYILNTNTHRSCISYKQGVQYPISLDIGLVLFDLAHSPKNNTGCSSNTII